MSWLRKDTFDLLLIFTVGVETALLVKFLDDQRQLRRDVDTLEAMIVYYADILAKNDVQLNKYDDIALRTIVETKGALYKKNPKRD